MNDTKVLFLDDNIRRHNIFFQNNDDLDRRHVYNAKDCLEKLLDEDEYYDIIFLDHDLDDRTNNILSDDEEDGRFVCREMTRNTTILNKYMDKTIVIHSLNSEGARTMKQILEDGGFKNIIIQPFVWEMHVRSEISKWV